MSIHTLKEINLDAARYRWVEQNVDELFIWLEKFSSFPSSEEVGAFIDKELASVNSLS